MFIKYKGKLAGQDKGFALGYIFVLIGAFLAISSSFLLLSTTENRSAEYHAQKINTTYIAQSGANIAHSALKLYIQNVNKEISEYHDWASLTNANNYLNFLTLGPLGVPPNNNYEITFYLNLAADNDHLLVHSEQPIINDLGNGATLETTITLTPAGNSLLSATEGLNNCLFPFKYSIASIGKFKGNEFTKSRITGEGTATVEFTSGHITQYALFCHSNDYLYPAGEDGWLTSMVRIDGPVHFNDSIGIHTNPVFNGPLTSSSANFLYHNNGSKQYSPLASYSDKDKPQFNAGYTLGTDPITLPTRLTELRQAVLGPYVDNPPSTSDHYFLPTDANGNFIGGIYVDRPVSYIDLQIDSNRQAIIIAIPKNADGSGSTTRFKFIIDYRNNKLIIQKQLILSWSKVAEYNSIPNGTVFIEGAINTISGKIQQDAKLSIGAAKDIIVEYYGFSYEKDPLTNPDAKNILALMCEDGNITIPWDSTGNFDIQGTLIALNGSLYFPRYDVLTKRGIMTIKGGLIQKNLGFLGKIVNGNAERGYGLHIVYDPRISIPEKAPLGLPRGGCLTCQTVREDGTDALDLVIWKKR